MLRWPMRGRARGCLLMTAAVVAMGLAACGRESPRPATRDLLAPARPVRTAVVERAGGTGSTAVPATVQARQRAALAARIPASVVALPWREGDRVSAGALLARLDDRALQSGLLAAESAAQAADVDLARMEALLKKGAATPKEAEESRARAAATVAAVAGARDSLAYAVLRAPFAGTVASRPANVGDVVTPGTTLIEIEGSGGLEVRATVEGGLVSRLRPGLAVEALVDGQPEPLTAMLRAVSASGDPATHRFEVRADLPAAPGLRSGLFARLLVPSPVGAPRLLVPSAAVFQRGGLNGLFVVAERTARLRWVAIGATERSLTEIRAGVDAGERVAVEPGGLVDGAPVSEASEAR
jgi:membrane fusion protein (multidrug efflux system)